MPFRPLLAALACAGTTVAAAAQSGSPSLSPAELETEDTTGADTDVAGTDDGVDWVIQAGGLYQFEADIDDGGAFSLTHGRGAVTATFTLSPESRLSAAISFDRYRYDFSDEGRFGGTEPWEDVNDFGASLLLKQHLSGRWGLLALGFIDVAAESGADAGDALTGGGGMGLTYTFNPSLTIGFGLTVATRLEDDPQVFPLVVVDWRINDHARLLAGRVDVASTLGPGFDLGWSFDDHWSMGVGARFRTTRFRLDDEDFAPDGVAEHQSVPVYARLSLNFGTGSSAFVFGGVSFAGSLEVDNRNGRRVFDEDYDAAPFIGAGIRLRF
ncbi:MAG: hypothetical protein KDA21_11905 [Phycisphaerales bacterium]|nr:hypothetical protein [Phycisphaerales bacterium]